MLLTVNKSPIYFRIRTFEKAHDKNLTPFLSYPKP